MKTYTVIFAQDVPHYGLVEIAARNDKDAIVKAKAHWRSIESGKKPWPLTEPDYDSAILARIVQITHDDGTEVAADIALDNYRLTNVNETAGAA
jgi:predicted metal-binding protein